MICVEGTGGVGQKIWQRCIAAKGNALTFPRNGASMGKWLCCIRHCKDCLSEFKLVYTSLISASPLHSDAKGHSPFDMNLSVHTRVAES